MNTKNLRDWIKDRLAPLVVAGALLVYLVYALFIEKQSLSYLHIICFALISLLVLIPLVTKRLCLC